jgi:DNA-directed RNA polymerase specialized sigma24 family protein
MEQTFSIDDSLLQSLTQGDFPAFKKIFDHLSPSIHGAARECFRSEALAKQFVAEIFSRVWREQATFKDVTHFNACMTDILKDLVHPYFIRALNEQITLGRKQESENKSVDGYNESVQDEKSAP